MKISTSTVVMYMYSILSDECTAHVYAVSYVPLVILEGRGDTLLEEATEVELLLRILGGVEEEEGGRTWEAVMYSSGGWGGSNMNCLNSERERRKYIQERKCTFLHLYNYAAHKCACTYM